MLGIDVCDPASARDVRNRPVQVEESTRGSEFAAPPSVKHRYIAGATSYPTTCWLGCPHVVQIGALGTIAIT